MDGLKVFCKYILFIFIFLVFSCSYHEGVYIKNDTEKKISINVQFETKGGLNELNFLLNENGYNAWEYETEYYKNNQIDESLIRMTIKTENGCEIIYSREDIIKVAVKRGMWEILISKELMKC